MNEPRKHSASGVSLFMRCPQAWAYNYLDGLRDVEVPWEDIEAGAPCTSRQRSLSLGSATHFALESRYLRTEYDWSRLPGVIGQSAFGQLPHPDECERVEVEGALGDLTVEGIPWNGRLDLTAWAARSVWEDIGLVTRSPFVLIDHKTSSNINRYAPSAAELTVGLQPNIYGLALALKHDVPRVTARWSYMQTGRTRKAVPIDFTVERSRAWDVVGEAAAFAHEANKLQSSAEAPRNTAACGDYGGCQYHRSAGGPCDARRSVGALIQARVPKRSEPMTMSPEILAKLNKYKKASTPAEPEAAEPEAAEPAPAKPARRKKKARTGAAQRAAEPEVEATDAPAATTRTRKPKAAATRVKQTPAPGNLAEMAAEYEAAVEHAETLRAAMREMLGGE